MELKQSHLQLWTRSTIDELMARQLVRPVRNAVTDVSTRMRTPTLPAARGVFRPGLRVVLLDETHSPGWADGPSGVTIEG